MLAIWIFFIISMAFNSCLGCIPTPQHDDYLIPPDPFTCENSAGAYIEDAIKLVDSSWGLAESQVCRRCPPSASQIHFHSISNPIPMEDAKEAAGTIDVTTCEDPCVCGFDENSCYQLGPGFPDMTLYPYCDADGCFLALVLTTPGELQKNIDPSMTYTYDNQRDGAGNLKPVTDENAYLRIQRVTCGPECVQTSQCS